MTAATTSRPATPAGGWWSDLTVLTARNLVHIRREPALLSSATVQPVMFTLLFIWVFGAAVVIPGGGDYEDYALAGLLLLNLSTASTSSAVGLAGDLSTGVMNRFRTLPMRPTTVLVASTASDLLNSILCSLVVAVTGLAVGWRPDAGPGSIVAGFAVIVAFNYALSWLGVCLGLAVTSAETAASLGLVIFLPLTFLSNALVPSDGMPAALRVFAEWNPFSAVATAGRHLLGNPNPAHGNWVLDHPVMGAVGWTAIILVAAVTAARALLIRRPPV